jgi:hypothetical protein
MIRVLSASGGLCGVYQFGGDVSVVVLLGDVLLRWCALYLCVSVFVCSFVCLSISLVSF